MKIYLASDHAGFDLKENVNNYLLEQKFKVEDCGAMEKIEDDDYPDFISIAAQKVNADHGSFGIVFGKSGTGECIVANKIKGIRGVVGFNVLNVKLAREDNNANVLCMGAEFVNFDTAKQLIDVFLNTGFSDEERHIRRLNKIRIIENK